MRDSKESLSLYRRMCSGQKAFIIAEAGVNHNGDMGIAYKLIDVAVEMNCDAVKFQTFKTECVISKKAPKARYQKQTTSAEESQFDMAKKFELDAQAFRDLIAYCAKKGITFLSTPFDEPSVDLLDELKLPVFKIPSGEITNIPFLKHVANKKKPIILSTGMSTLSEVKRAVKVIKNQKNSRIILLHCVTSYPAPLEQINLRAMETLAKALKLPVGYSDHTEGIDATLGAVVLGAKVIEKHFTLDKNLPGPDHKASLEPAELGQMVMRIRALEAALGDGKKKPAPCEIENMVIARKSVIAAQALKAGQVITVNDLTIKRPGNGITPGDIRRVVGRKARRDISFDEVITWKDIT